MTYVSPVTVSTRVIPGGHEGIEETVELMRTLARDEAERAVVKKAAARVTRGARSGLEEAEAIRAYVSRVRFEFDPPDQELIRTPTLLVRTIDRTGHAYGDCDDVAVLGAALGLARGLDARYVLVGLTEREPFEHVYTELEAREGAVELDTTRPDQFPPGVEVRRTSVRRI